MFEGLSVVDLELKIRGVQFNQRKNYETKLIRGSFCGLNSD